MWPLAGIVVEDACGGGEGDDLEEAGSQRILGAVVARMHQHYHDEGCGADHEEDEQAQLGVLDELAHTALEHGEV